MVIFTTHLMLLNVGHNLPYTKFHVPTYKCPAVIKFSFPVITALFLCMQIIVTKFAYFLIKYLASKFNCAMLESLKSLKVASSDMFLL